ncbi:MAG: dTMP kinase [Gammaproteobacteria bacterium]|jgi:dTMP kinase|nr:dTMP kinase [Gammaproteobacteria bacterium]
MSKFITLEGIEGVGKTSNRDYIRDLLEATGKPCIVTREPGGTALGEALRELLLQHAQEKICDDAELLLMFAARAEHLHKVIRPALAAGKYVLCDRFTEATYAYQGGGRQLNMDKIAELEKLVQGDLRPDLSIILDAPVEVGRERAGQRSAPDRIEQEKNDFFERVRSAYLDLAGRHPERICTVDANQPLAQVQQQIQQQLQVRGII